MYHLIDRLHTLYGLLQDEQSKEIFLARFAIDMEPSILHLEQLLLAGGRELGCTQPQKEVLKELSREHKKIVLYGAGQVGRSLAKMFEYEQISFYGFCDQRADMFPDGLLGKPVLSPDKLAAHKDEYYVVIAVITKKPYTEITQFLWEHNYPKEHILNWVDQRSLIDGKQYFEFPSLYRRGTAFIDGGCYDCETSRRFAEWCGGEYSSIIAFEPDPDNYAKCCKSIQGVPLSNFKLVDAGLSSQEGMAVFAAKHAADSRIISIESDSNDAKSNLVGNKIPIRTVAIDDIAGDCKVGFIKMDIEGAELDALHGAKNTILRDKPLLAICVYHLRGDVFAIMDYLHQLLPEYRFYLRHYMVSKTETVLYASVDL